MLHQPVVHRPAEQADAFLFISDSELRLLSHMVHEGPTHMANGLGADALNAVIGKTKRLSDFFLFRTTSKKIEDQLFTRWQFRDRLRNGLWILGWRDLFIPCELDAHRKGPALCDCGRGFGRLAVRLTREQVLESHDLSTEATPLEPLQRSQADANDTESESDPLDVRQLSRDRAGSASAMGGRPGYDPGSEPQGDDQGEYDDNAREHKRGGPKHAT